MIPAGFVFLSLALGFIVGLIVNHLSHNPELCIECRAKLQKGKTNAQD